MLQSMYALLGQDLLIGQSEAQIKHGYGVIVRRSHGFGDAHRGCFHTGMINGKTVQQGHGLFLYLDVATIVTKKRAMAKVIQQITPCAD